jgi:CHAT domain-containing protein
MNIGVRIFSAGFVCLFALLPAVDLPDLDAARSHSVSPSARLDAALRSGDLEGARELVLDDQDGADLLFLGYLEQAVEAGELKPAGSIRPLELARRLADVFFRIYEFDFERGIVAGWEKASAARKREWLPILRDHYAAYRDARSESRRIPRPVGKSYLWRGRRRALADRYRKVSFGKGELQALLWSSGADPFDSWKTWQLAKALGDEVGEAWAAYYFGMWAGDGQAEFAAGHAVEAAERLRLPKLRQLALIRLAWRALARGDHEAHIGYLRRGLEVARTVPARQGMAAKGGASFYPGEAWFLKSLWRAYGWKGIPGGRELFEQGRALSRRYGGEAGELAYLLASMQEFVRPGLIEDVASEAESLARRMADPGWLAVFLAARARGLEGTRNFPAAFKALEEAAAIYDKAGDRGHFAECLEKRAILRVQTNDISAAKADYEDALEIIDALGLPEDAMAMRTRAGVALKAQPKLGLKFLNETLAEAERLHEPGYIRGAYSGSALVLENHAPAESLDYLQKALFYCELHRANIGYPGEVPVAMHTVSQGLRRMGRYAEAVEMEERRARYARAEGLADAEADAYYWLSLIHRFDLGDTAKAAESAEEYVRLMIRPRKRLTVNACDRIAGVYLAIGQLGRALEYWSKALEQAKEMPSGAHFERMVRIAAARTRIELGDYDAAISELEAEGLLIERTFQPYQEPNVRNCPDLGEYDAFVPELSAADAIIERKFQSYQDPIEIQRAEWLNRKALAHVLAGDLDRAVEEAMGAIEFELKTPPGTSPAQYYPHFNPGDALALAGRVDEAIDYHKKRRERAREIKSLDEEREALLKLGSTCARAGKINEARKALREAVEIGRLPPGPQVGRLAEPLLALGEIELRAGNLPRAEEFLIEARKTANPYDLNQLWRAENALASVSAAQRKYELAERHFEQALSALEGGRERLRPEELTLRFGMDRLQVYNDYASFLAGRAIETGDEAGAEKAMMVVERRRSQALWDLMALGWARLPLDAVPEQMERARRAEARIAAKMEILRDQFGRPPEKRNSALISTLESDLKLAKEEHTRLLTALAQGKFRFASPSPLPSNLIAAARKKLGPKQVLLEYLVADRDTFGFVLSSAGLRLSRLPVSRQELRKNVQGLLQPYYRLDSGEADVTRLGFDFPMSLRLYTQLIAPLESRFGDASQILVVPDDALLYLPLELLVDALPGVERPGEALFAECEQARFLVRRFTVSYLTAAAQVLAGPESSESGAPALALLAMANPTARKDSGSSGQDDPVRRRLRSTSFGEELTPLPGSTEEVAQIRRYFPAGRATILTGAGATEARYKALSPRSGIIHLATHAIAADDHPFYSTLVLAPDSAGGEDGFLQAYEILRCQLRARLVVMSACETARGPLGRGEGLVGLVSAFLQAGAHSVLATQWSIDESAAELMASFYKAFTGGEDAARALREAKLDLLKKRLSFAGTKVSLAHPFFWAPFVLIGSGN